MSSNIKRLAIKAWKIAHKKLIILLALIIGISVGFYFFNEWFAVKLEEIIFKELSKPYVAINKNYEIYEINQPGGPYQYFIFDNNHNLLDYGYTTRIEPKITFTHNLIKLHVSLGTGYFICRYYDPNKRLVSDWFENPINESETLVVYADVPFDKWQLVVQNMFDKSKYFLTIERNFSHATTPVTQADFIDNGIKLEITYTAGEDKHEVTEIIDLYDAESNP